MALESGGLVFPPVVLTEVVSGPGVRADFADFSRIVPLLVVRSGYWERAAATRAEILSKRRRARLADTLISQSCIDHDTPLLTRDRDFRHFAEFAGLRLV